MKQIIFAFLCFFGFSGSLSAHAEQAALPCDDKLAALEQQGVNRGAFLQALKNVRSGDKPSRYVLMAHLGREKEGEMHLVDTHTGRVEHFKMWHGYPENHGASLNHQHHETTFFGGMQLRLDEEDFRSKHRIKTEIISPSLKNKLAIRDGQPGGNQVLLKCSKKFRDNPKRQLPSMNDPCMEPKDVDKVFRLLKAEKDQNPGPPAPSVVMFTYPTRNLNNYLTQVKLSNDLPNVCQTLAKMPSPRAAPAAPGAGDSSGGVD